MSVSTVYQNYGYEFSENHESGGDWNAKWSSTSGDHYGQNYTPFGQIYRGSGSYDIYRATMTYDTSAIPSAATIHSAVWNGYIKKAQDYSEGYNAIYLCPVSATGNSAGYYNKAYFGTQLANIQKDDVNSDNVNQWWQPSIATTAITKAGTTILGLRHYHDYNNSAPWGDGTCQFYFSPYNDATYKSYLTITWTTAPVVTTGSVTDLQPISATLGGNVTDAGGGTVSTRGVCWNTSTNPTTSNSKTATTGTTGAFTVSTGQVLLPGTLYYARAYVTTENSTTYGDNVTFRTPGGAILFNLL